MKPNSLRIFHPNGIITGCMMELSLIKANEQKMGRYDLALTRQNKDEDVTQEYWSTNPKDNCRVQLFIDTIGKILSVFSGKEESVYEALLDENDKIHHFKLSRINEPVSGYKIEIECDTDNIFLLFLSNSEAKGLYEVIRGSLYQTVFG